MATRLLAQDAMAHVVLIYHNSPLTLPDGRLYTAQACGRQRDDGMWEGWLEFVPDDGSVVLRSRRETTQPNLADLEYWATGITPVYLKGALERTLTPPPVAAERAVISSVYDEPAPARVSAAEVTPEPSPVLNPYSVYTKGEDLLRRQLGALSPRHLRAIIVGYDLANPSEVDLDALTVAESIELIVVAVRGRLAA
jgi:hypothetical protein